jgi:hypothetical protein
VTPTTPAAVLDRLRGTLNVNAVHTGARRPFKFLVCGDPALISALRCRHAGRAAGDTIPAEAAAVFETLDRSRPADTTDARAVICCGRPVDRTGMHVDQLTSAGCRSSTCASMPDRRSRRARPSPRPGGVEEYVVDRLAIETLRGRFLPHLIDCCRGSRSPSGAVCPRCARPSPPSSPATRR